MYDDIIYKNKRRILTSIIGLFAVIIAWAVWIYIDRYGKTPLTISAVPADAKVLVNNQKLGNGTHWLNDGSYKIKATKDGYKSQEVTYQLSAKRSQNVVPFSLEPQSSDARKWVNDHQSEYKRNEQFGALAAKANGQYFTDQNPITKVLPFTDPYFTIGYRVEKDQSIILTILTPSPRYRFYAIEKIRDLGYDPTDFRIDFKDFRNPLEQR